MTDGHEPGDLGGRDGADLGRRRLLTLAGAAVAVGLPITGGARAAQHCTEFDPWGIRFCTVGIPTPLVGQSALPQFQSQWCWAACISMIFDYYDRPVRQERVVLETFGAIVDMPANPLQILTAINRDWRDEHGRSFRGYGQALPIDPVVADRYLRDERPLIIGSLGHATVLTALSWAQDTAGRQELVGIVVRDPALGGQRREYSGQEVWSTMFLAHVAVA